MKINVTREDIRNGKAGKPTACMVALALKRELGVSYASVGYRDGKILINGQYVKVYFPKSVEKKIRFWDGFHFVFPFSFELVTEGFLVGATITFEATEVRSATPVTCGLPQIA